MTENRRIFWNTVASSARGIYGLICGIFTARWVLQALGETDYGLYGLVGGLTVFISFIVNVLHDAVGRFYAFSVGEAKACKSYQQGIENCQRWFNTAVLIFTVFPLILLAIGYPIIEYGLRHEWLNIPENRVEACVLVFRCVCVTSFVGMICVPFNAMYSAKQYIAELTIYSFITTTLNFIVMYYMATHPGEWLVKYAMWMVVLSVLPQSIISLRAVKLFHECRFNKIYLWDIKRMKSIFSFAGWQFIHTLSGLVNNQGVAIVVNKFFGASVNAANSLAQAFNNYSNVFSSNIWLAFSPAITNACGAGDYRRMLSLAYKCSKICTFMILIFALPLLYEVDTVLSLWLTIPPKYTGILTRCVLITVVIEKTTNGFPIAVSAKGKIAGFQLMQGLIFISTLPISIILIKMTDLGVLSIGYAMIFSMCMCVIGRIIYARKLIGISARYWFRRIFIPLLITILISLVIGLVPQNLVCGAFLRLCVTTITIEFTLFVCGWFMLFDSEEREFLIAKITEMIERFKRK